MEARLDKEIADLMVEYHEKIDSYTRAEEREAHEKIKAKKLELSAYLSEGANNCIACDMKPDGMLKRPAIYTPEGLMDKAPIYSIYCGCGNRRLGNSREQAIENWNNYNPVKE